MTEFIYFFLLQGTTLGLLIAAHQQRAKITMGPLFALTGVFMILLWQVLQLGWWIENKQLIIDASRLSLLPALLSGAIMVYALDGLRAARAYWFTLSATGTLAIAFAVFQYQLAKQVPIPELFYLSPYTHFTILSGILLSVLTAYLIFALLKYRNLFSASLLSIILSTQVSLLSSSLLEYGLFVGLTNYYQQAFTFLLFSVLPALLTSLYIFMSNKKTHFLPRHSIRDLLSFWLPTRDNLAESNDDILNANKVISDLQRLNQALKESNHINEYQLERSPMAIIYTNLQGAIVFFNPSAQKLLLLDNNQKNIMGFINEYRQFEQLCKNILKTPAGQHISLTINNVTRQCEIILTHRLDAMRQHIGYHIVLNDITAQEQQRQHEQMTARVKGIHSAGKVIIHDFSNLLLGLQGTLVQLKNSPPSQLDQQDIYINTLEKGIKRGKEMLQQLSLGETFSSPRLHPININQLIDEALQLSAHQAHNKHINLLKQWTEILWINADSTQILRVLNNLLCNALRATPEGGTIQITLTKKNNGASISVSDTGSGISKRNLDSIFDPGFTTKTDGKGGLGMAISYLNIEAHGGELTVKQNQPQGLIVTIWLPLSLQQKETPVFLDKKIILFIKNKAEREQFYKRYAYENEVVEALNTQEVHALLEEDHWDSIMSDQEIKVPAQTELISIK